MRRIVWSVVGILMAFSLVEAQARGILGQRMVSIGGGVAFVGDEDVKKYDDTISYYGMDVVVPVHKYVDLGLSVAYAELEGTSDEEVSLESEAKGVLGGATVHLRPDSGMDPYIGAAVAYTETESEAKRDDKQNSHDDDSTYGIIDAGVEFDLGCDFSVTPSISYNGIGEDGEYWEASVSLNKWLTKSVGVDVSAGYDFDDEDVSVDGALLIGF